MKLSKITCTLITALFFSGCATQTGSLQETNSSPLATREIAESRDSKNIRVADERARDLVKNLSLDEKIAQMNDVAPEVPRLNIPAYNWHTEGAHGAWAWGGIPTTVYPQVIGLAATWDTDLIHQVAVATSDEVRAVYALDSKRNPTGKGNNGLSIFAPNINIFRDPRWGRGQETYGEDPFLTSRLSVEFIKGLQGDDPNYLKVAATAKHFAVYSGPEEKLFKTDITVSKKDIYETFLPAFETAVKEGHVASVMCAYGSVNGAPACASDFLLKQTLRESWGFKGLVVSDCGAVADIWKTHHYVHGQVNGASTAIDSGTDLACGSKNGKNDFDGLKKAVEKNKIQETTVDDSVSRLFAQRFRLGMFDDQTKNPFQKSDLDSPEHRALAIKAAQESMVLLKNQNYILPLSRHLKQISVIGPNAIGLLEDKNHKPMNILYGTYHGVSSKFTTPLAGIQEKLKNISPATKVIYDDGKGDLAGAVNGSDVAVLILGLQPVDDDKDGEFPNGEGEGRDRDAIELPLEQLAMVKTVQATGVPMVVVLLNGSAVASIYLKENANAILEAWYPGEEGGTAIADVLFGDYNPSGRLPITFYESTKDLPAYESYKMEGRTYRYFSGKVMYPFGFGLSFTQFKYSNLQIQESSLKPGQNLNLSVDIENEDDATRASTAGDEVVQVYLTAPSTVPNQPIRSLKAFSRVHLDPHERKTVQFSLTPAQLSLVMEDGSLQQTLGNYSFTVGGQQATAVRNGATNIMAGHFSIAP
jgi:beta-glucosidase